ncbi:MAG: 4Fe-4S dicluster domain-containing protein [Candidatus Bathyarchaeota archaeon]|nr:4Fe-4S dicluster domain-containing protein [Candidatus Bathyarchaeota archaeon]MDH5663489.1 4Fe-4S dicluster domain-containing protein [Candidatus Bathyarchaeota archaeon]
MKLLKNETENELTIEMILHAKRYSLTLDKTRCTGCGICAEICPREAIEIKKIPKADGEKTKPPTIDISEEKCHYCGMCDPICPFGALKVRINGEHMIPVINSESFPQLIREIEVDTTRCDLDCVDCEKACPLKLIKVSVHAPNGEEVTDIKSRPNKENLTVTVDIEKKFCPCCRLCEMKCPEGAIHVEKTFHGNLRINREKCPEGCQDCLDVCPIPEALYLSDDGKVYVNELYCVYCGVCRIVCPEEEALELHRTYIRHTPVHSGAWNKALEKLTSTKVMTNELRTKSSTRAKESIGKRFLWRRNF